MDSTVKETTWRNLPPGGEGPLYRQLAKMILADIKNGVLKPDSNLPTVREMAEVMKLSTGTVKHAYDELERLGAIEKARGRGTFVSSGGDCEAQGKKDRAMHLLDSLLDEMRNLGFSLTETRIFIDLKMREREDDPRCANILLTDCNPEALTIISGQISRINGAKVTCRLLDDLPRALELLDEEPDIIVTTANHSERVKCAAARDELVSRVVLSPSHDTVARLAKAGGGGRTGILTASERFARIIRAVRAELVTDAADLPNMLFGAGDTVDFLRALDIVILPEQYARHCTQGEIIAIRDFEEGGGVIIEFAYNIDAGSLMYLEQRIESVLTDKK